jgi:hypothetical protein
MYLVFSNFMYVCIKIMIVYQSFFTTAVNQISIVRGCRES